MKRIAGVLVALTLAFGFHLPAGAESLGDGDRATIKSIIQDQIDAFQHDDGATAYSFASPGIQAYYPTVDDFMQELIKAGGLMPYVKKRLAH